MQFLIQKKHQKEFRIPFLWKDNSGRIHCHCSCNSFTIIDGKWNEM